MTDAELAQRILAALTEAAGDGATLVSVDLTRIGEGSPARIEAITERRTRTLLFLSAQALASDGSLIARASSVHKHS